MTQMYNKFTYAVRKCCSADRKWSRKRSRIVRSPGDCWEWKCRRCENPENRFPRACSTLRPPTSIPWISDRLRPDRRDWRRFPRNTARFSRSNKPVECLSSLTDLADPWSGWRSCPDRSADSSTRTCFPPRESEKISDLSCRCRRAW